MANQLLREQGIYNCALVIGKISRMREMLLAGNLTDSDAAAECDLMQSMLTQGLEQIIQAQQTN